MTNPVFLEERERLLQIFPVEIWQLVFDRVEDPDDISNCSKASPYFGHLLEPQRTFYLLPEVLRVLDEQEYLDANDAPDVLNLRGVSSRWKCAVHKFLENQPYQLKPQEYFPLDSYRSQPSIVHGTHFRLYDFTVRELENELLPELCSPFYQKHNPFPSRHLEISEGRFPWNGIPHQEAIRLYRTHTDQFLEKVGHHFWHAEIDIRVGQLEFYRLIRKYAGFMRNLRSLHIMSPEFFGSGYLVLSRYLSPSEVKFPELRHLEFLSTDRLVGPALNEILKTNNKINCIKICRKYQDCFDVTRIGTFPETLSISLATADEFSILPESENLHTLHLYLCNVPTKTLNLSHIFEKLERYGQSLEELHLEPPIKQVLPLHSQQQFNRSLKPLNLPNLKRLDIKLSCNCSIDFLLGLTSLKQLILRLDYTDRKLVKHECIEFREETINFYDGFTHRILECNIWDLIPSLKEITLIVTSQKVGTYKRCQRIGSRKM